MKRTLLMASIAFIPTLAWAQPSALPDRPIVLAQGAQPADPADQRPNAKRKQDDAKPQAQPSQRPGGQKPQPQQAQPQGPKAQPQQRQAQPTQQPAAAPKQAPAAQQRVERKDNRQERRQDAQQQRQERREDAQQQRQENRQENRQERREQRQETQQNRQDNRPGTQQEQRRDAQQDQQRRGTTTDQRQDNRQERRDDRQDTRQDRREDRRDDRQDARQDRREDRRDDRRDARQERREDRRMDAVRSERRERREGDRTVIEERDRTIIRQGNRTIIRHDDDVRFRRAGADIRVTRRGDRTERVIVRPNGVRIVTTVDSNGRLVRRSRFVNNREYVLFTNQPAAGFGFIVNVPPPVIRIPRERYIVEYREAPPALIYDTLVAEPVMPIERQFSLDQVRYNYDVRARMPRIDIDSITFETGSWDVSPDQAAKLEPIAAAMKRAIEKNPNEVYMVEGHTDAVGSDDDNLLLSDRRAQAVTEVLTEEFGVPPENMIPQGYGEQNLKVETDGPEERNRYVSVRRVTPLLANNQ